MTIKIIFTTIFISFWTWVQGQSNTQQLFNIILDEAKIDSTFKFGKWTKDGKTESHLKYLGVIIMTSGHKYRLVNYIYYSGRNKRTTSRLLIFHYNKNEIANYYQFTLQSDLPDKLERNKIIFNNKNNPECDTSITTVVQIEAGFPKKIYIKCTADSGNYYQINDSD